ncbi:MAG: hypothetical protein KAH30_03575 [Caldisericia bacterium]|nr:hypothetical protein [Caldisericia bacterium]
MSRYLLVIILIVSLFTGIATGETLSNECRTGRIFLVPSSSLCANGNNVTYTFTYKNNNSTTLPSGSATFKVGEDFEIISTTPSMPIIDSIVNFTIPKLTPGLSFFIKITLKVDTTETRIGYPMLVTGSVTHRGGNDCSTSSQSVVFLWAPTKYPLIDAQLKETARKNGKIDFDLIIEGGYPPYEYSVYWDDGSEKNNGGLTIEGDVELSHTYENSGEFNIICRITDSLGRHKVIRKRIYLLPWKKSL